MKEALKHTCALAPPSVWVGRGDVTLPAAAIDTPQASRPAGPGPDGRTTWPRRRARQPAPPHPATLLVGRWGWPAEWPSLRPSLAVALRRGDAGVMMPPKNSTDSTQSS